MSKLLTGVVYIQKHGRKVVAGLPFKSAWDTCKDGTCSWQALRNNLLGLTCQDLCEMGGFFCILEPGTFCVSPPGMVLIEFVPAQPHAVSLTLSYEFLGHYHCQDKFTYCMTNVLKQALSICTEPNHADLEHHLNVRHSVRIISTSECLEFEALNMHDSRVKIMQAFARK